MGQFGKKNFAARKKKELDANCQTIALANWVAKLGGGHPAPVDATCRYVKDSLTLLRSQVKEQLRKLGEPCDVCPADCTGGTPHLPDTWAARSNI